MTATLCIVLKLHWLALTGLFAIESTIIQTNSFFRTLLAFMPKRNQFIEYDSLHKAPSKNGKALADKLEQLLQLDCTNCTYSVETVPTQTNNYDCGIYVIMILVRYKLYNIYSAILILRISQELFVQLSAPPPPQMMYTYLSSRQLLEKRKQIKQLIYDIFSLTWFAFKVCERH